MQESGKKAEDENFRLTIKISKDDREDILFDDDVSEKAIRRVIRLADDILAKKKGDSQKRL